MPKKMEEPEEVFFAPLEMRERHEGVPTGFLRRRKGAKVPIEDESAFVELIILTKEGYGSTGPTKLKYHDQSIPIDEVGGIVGYRRLP